MSHPEFWVDLAGNTFVQYIYEPGTALVFIDTSTLPNHPGFISIKHDEQYSVFWNSLAARERIQSKELTFIN